MVVQRNDSGARRGCCNWRSRRNEKELRGNEDSFEHQVKRLRVGQLVAPSQVERGHQDIQFGLRRWPAEGFPGKRPGDFARRLPRVVPRRGRWAEQPLLDLCPPGARQRRHLAQHLVGDGKVLLELEGRERVEVPLAADFIRQSIGDRRVDPEEIPQRVAVFGLGQPPDDEGSGILVAEVLQLRQPLAEHAAVGLVRLGGAFGRHVMDLHAGVRSLPLFGEGRVPGGLECGCEIDSTPGWPPALVAGDAIGIDKRHNAVAEVLVRVSLQGFVIRGHCAARRCDAQDQGEA